METTQILSLLGGIGLFLYGMTVMSSGLRAVAGDRMRDILERVAGNRVAAAAIGVLVTLLIQSSSATDMMVIGFVSAGMMRLAQAVGVIMGASIGTTVTAQITAFNLTAYAPRRRFGLPVRDDDFTLFDLGTSERIDPADFLSKGKSTPFTGWEVRAKCVLTVSCGRIAYLDAKARTE